MLNKEELMVVYGGAKLSGTVINAIVRVVNAALELGRSVGSAIRRAKNRKLCTV